MEPIEKPHTVEQPSDSLSPPATAADDAAERALLKKTLYLLGDDAREMTIEQMRARIEERRAAQADAKPGGESLMRSAVNSIPTDPIAIDKRWLRKQGIDAAAMSDDEVRAEVQRVEKLRHKQEIDRDEQRMEARRSELKKIARCPELHIDDLSLDLEQNARWKAARDLIVTRTGEADPWIGVFLGSKGTGKTQMLTSAIWTCSDRLFTCRYWSMPELWLERRRARATAFVGGAMEAKLFDDLIRPDLLALDEVHERGEDENEQTWLVSLVDRRHRSKKITVMAANQSPEEFAAAIGPSIVSRIHRRGEVFVCNWPTHRVPDAWRAKPSQPRSPSGLRQSSSDPFMGARRPTPEVQVD